MSTPTPRKFKVLIVEDQENTSFLEAATLKKMGLDVEVVSRGDHAIPKMKAWKPDVVVLDLELEGMTGTEIMKAMLDDEQLRDMPLVANTGHMDGKDQLGFDYYYHYRRMKQKEPIMVNKLPVNGVKPMSLAYVVGHVIGQEYKMVPLALLEYMEDMDVLMLKERTI